MRLTDISLNWLLPGAVLLLGMLAAVAVLARGKRSSVKDTSADDSWERSEERRRRKEAVYGTVSYVLLFCCAAVAAALSFHGLVGFGEQNLGLTGGWQYLVPFGLDGAAMFCSVLAVREASHGDAALGSRILVWTFAFAAAWFNWVHAPRGVGHAGAPHFFAGMSLSAAVLFDRALKQTRRAALREQGLVPRPLPQIRIVRWLRAPRETYRAWSLMLLEGVRSLDEAVEEVREDKIRKDEAKQRRRDQQRVERARLKAISRGHRGFVGRGGGRELETATVERDSELVSAEPAISAPEALPVRARPSLQPVRTGGSDAVTVDLTAEDDTQALPRLDSLERKLKDLEQQFG
ncbi:membrane protein [Streptomyces malachitofuscus]|nr:membrane protein [Streptomyces malachitofuscus]